VVFSSAKGKIGTSWSGAGEATGKKEMAANCFSAPVPFYGNKISCGFRILVYGEKWGKLAWLQWKTTQYLSRGSSSKHWDAMSHDSKGRWQEGKEQGARQGRGSHAIGPLGMSMRQYQWHSYSLPSFPLSRLITSCLRFTMVRERE